MPRNTHLGLHFFNQVGEAVFKKIENVIKKKDKWNFDELLHNIISYCCFQLNWNQKCPLKLYIKCKAAFSTSPETEEKKQHSKARLTAEAFCTVICNPYYVTTTFPKELSSFFFFLLFQLCLEIDVENCDTELVHPAV